MYVIGFYVNNTLIINCAATSLSIVIPNFLKAQLNLTIGLKHMLELHKYENPFREQFT